MNRMYFVRRSARLGSVKWDELMRRFRARLWAACVATGLAVSCAHGGENAPAEPALQGDSASRWIQQLGADDYAARERATEALCAADSSVVPALRAYREKCDDVEVQKRIAKVLAALEVVGFDKTFTQLANDVTDREHNAIAVSNAHAKGTLEVSAGKLVWVQKYQGQTVRQTYSFPAETPLTVKGRCAIPLKFDKMDASDGAYNPDNVRPSLVVENTPAGLQLSLSTTDCNDCTNHVVFGPAPAKPEKAEPEAPEVQEPELEIIDE